MEFRGWWHPPLIPATASQMKASLVYKVKSGLCANARPSDPISQKNKQPPRQNYTIQSWSTNCYLKKNLLSYLLRFCGGTQQESASTEVDLGNNAYYSWCSIKI